jgi:hypothetical protein
MNQLSAKRSTKPSTQAATSFCTLTSALAATLAIGCVEPDAEVPEESASPEAAPGGRSLAQQLADDQPTDRELHLVVRVVIGDERAISFHEPVPGILAVSQLGRDRVSPFELPRDPRAAFELVAPGVTMPAVLEAAIARTQGADDAPPALAESVTIQVLPDRHRGAFPASSFNCWVYQQRHCLYNQSYFEDFGLQARRQRRLQVAWAVDLNVVTTLVVLNYTPNWDPAANKTNYWDTWAGWWRTFDVSGNFGAIVRVRSNYQFPGTNNFHYSSAVY